MPKDGEDDVWCNTSAFATSRPPSASADDLESSVAMHLFLAPSDFLGHLRMRFEGWRSLAGLGMARTAKIEMGLRDTRNKHEILVTLRWR